MEIPPYIIINTARHLERLLTNVTCDPADHLTRDALRLAGKDLKQLKKYARQHQQR